VTKSGISRARRVPAWVRWSLRIVGGLGLLVLLLFGGLIVAYQIWGAPQQRAEQQRAAAFARLTGAARRVAIYDAFVAQTDRHYYDQSFAGVDWPNLKREWRVKAGQARNDGALYTDVLFQIQQRFPTSHLSIFSPNTAFRPAGPATAEKLKPVVLCDERDMGMQLVSIRRAGGVHGIVGDVWPGSPAARAGIAPGWIPQRWTVTPSNGRGHVEAVFIALEPAEAQRFDETGSIQLLGQALSTEAEGVAALKARERRVALDYTCGAQDPDFESRRLASGALYIRFDAFLPQVLEKVRAALAEAGPQGVVLDLRTNRGGYPLLGLNMLIGPRRLVYLERDADGLHRQSTDLWTRRYRGPLVVLIGPASSSAAEITAATLKREGRAIVAGRRTNGAVLASRMFPLPDGGQVQLPVSDVLMPDQSRLENIGVTPDIRVYPTAAQVQAGRDMALERGDHELQRLQGRRG
jgi:carboxyl-terminal processing protease